MTPKEKASELFYRFRNIDNESYLINRKNSKKIALIFVEETLKLCDGFGVTPINKSCFNTFWNEVKEEINNYEK